VLTALIPMAVIAGLPAVRVILVVVAPINVLRVLFSAAQNASIPTLAGRDRLSAGAAYFEAVWAFGYVLGPALAGLLIAVVGPGPTIALDAFSFAFSAGSVLLVRRSLAPPPPAGAARSVAAEVRDGLNYVWSHRQLRLTIAYYAALSLLMAPFVPAFTYFLVRDRGMDAGGLGLMISVFSSGMVVGALVATRLKPENLGLRMVVAAIVTGAGLAVGRSVPSPVLLGLMGLVMGAAWTIVEVSYVTLRLAASPEALLGRISTVAKTVTVGVQPVGMLVGGLLIDRVGGGTTLAAIGLMTVILSIGFWASGSLRNRQSEGSAEPAGAVAGSVAGEVAL
jgi:predicted MFS family arabinose efflux permease